MLSPTHPSIYHHYNYHLFSILSFHNTTTSPPHPKQPTHLLFWLYYNPIQVLYYSMKGNKKVLCKFRENCRKYKAGEECVFSHDKCKFGSDCNKENCIYFHQPNSNSNTLSNTNSQLKNSAPDARTPLCKQGINCKFLAKNKCRYLHPEASDHSQIPQIASRENTKPKMFQKARSETPCGFGERCNLYALGKCLFLHERVRSEGVAAERVEGGRLARRQGRQNTFLQSMEQLCQSFLLNAGEEQRCGKLHEYSLNKDIKKIFEISSSQIQKWLILEPHEDEEKPIYVILTEGRIIFCHLLNLAKESGHEEFRSTTMCLKRCYGQDLSVPNHPLLAFNTHARADLLTAYSQQHIYIIFLKTKKMARFALHAKVVSCIFIGQRLIIVFEDKSKMVLGLKPDGFTFGVEQGRIEQPMSKLIKCDKLVYGCELAMGVSQKKVCLINEKLQVEGLQIGKQIVDIDIVEHEGLPIGLVLTKSDLIAINLLTFQKKVVLDSLFAQPQIGFTSITHTMHYLFIAIDFWGVLIYKMNEFQKPMGVLCLGNRSWQVSCDGRGNVGVLSLELGGREKSLMVYRMLRG